MAREKKETKVAVLGAGSWGTAMAVLLSGQGRQVAWWGIPPEHMKELAATRVNSRYLPGVKIRGEVMITSHMAEALKDSDMIFLAIPAQALRQVLLASKEHLTRDVIIVNGAKGLEIETCLRMSQVVQEVLGEDVVRKRYAILSGPSHAEEVGIGLPTAVVAAAIEASCARLVQDVFMSDVFRVYTSSDVVGVELGGALKNIIALATGIAEGLGFGDNTKAALVTRGLAEMTRLGVRLGAKAETFAGLSGLGDLVVTCNSKHSRNLRAGRLIGQGYSRQEALAEVGMVVEGVSTVLAARELSRREGVDMPITEAVYLVLYEGYPAKEAVVNLMRREKKDEIG